MAQILKLGPLTRVEGHLDIEVTLDQVNGKLAVVDAISSGTMFRGLETILFGRAPRDATNLTARVCGVCPISHALASSEALEAAAGIPVPDNGRIERNLVLGANFLQSHVLHFYHLALADYVDLGSVLNMSPWTPSFTGPDMISAGNATRWIEHYVQALAIRRQAHQMGAIFGGRMPCSPTIVPGGCTNMVTAQQVTQYKALLAIIQDFIKNVYMADVAALASQFGSYFGIGRGYDNLLAYGVFDLDDSGSNKLFKRGRFTGGRAGEVNPAAIKEYTRYSYFTAASGNRTMSTGLTQPQADKAGAYSWIKAPRYDGLPHEAGPLARMYVNGDYRNGISVMDRISARAMEAMKVADAMSDWLDQLVPGRTCYTNKTVTAGTGIGLTEAPRGALGHWTTLAAGKISTYQILTPTGWNASPRDDAGVPGPIEKALMGVEVRDPQSPLEVLRVVHSFDPCLSCAVHTVRP